jgi:hypothetical protein
MPAPRYLPSTYSCNYTPVGLLPVHLGNRPWRHSRAQHHSGSLLPSLSASGTHNTADCLNYSTPTHVIHHHTYIRHSRHCAAGLSHRGSGQWFSNWLVAR